jgi:hypothetical protein
MHWEAPRWSSVRRRTRGGPLRSAFFLHFLGIVNCSRWSDCRQTSAAINPLLYVYLPIYLPTCSLNWRRVILKEFFIQSSLSSKIQYLRDNFTFRLGSKIQGNENTKKKFEACWGYRFYFFIQQDIESPKIAPQVITLWSYTQVMYFSLSTRTELLCKQRRKSICVYSWGNIIYALLTGWRAYIRLMIIISAVVFHVVRGQG